MSANLGRRDNSPRISSTSTVSHTRMSLSRGFLCQRSRLPDYTVAGLRVVLKKLVGGCEGQSAGQTGHILGQTNLGSKKHGSQAHTTRRRLGQQILHWPITSPNDGLGGHCFPALVSGSLSETHRQHGAHIAIRPAGLISVQNLLCPAHQSCIALYIFLFCKWTFGNIP